MKRMLAIILAIMMILPMLPASAAQCNHNWKNQWEPHPTCTQGDRVEQTCTKCGARRNQDVKPLGHKWETTVTKQPTCTEEGTGTRKCVRPVGVDTGIAGHVCGANGGTVTLPALGHEWGGWKTVVEPNCVSDGYREARCSRCKHLMGHEDLPALGHDWDIWYEVKAPTIEEPGIEQHDCKRCGLSEQRPTYLEGYGPEGQEELTAFLQITNHGAGPNGEYYDGELVTFSYCVENPTDYAATEIVVYTDCAQWARVKICEIPVLNPHDTYNGAFTYTVLGENVYLPCNAGAQMIVDYNLLSAYDSTKSNIVPFDMIPNAEPQPITITITLTQTSAPTHSGMYYECEQVHFSGSWTNTTGEEILDVKVKTTSDYTLWATGVMQPGASITDETYVIPAMNPTLQEVYNAEEFLVIYWTDLSGAQHQATSNYENYAVTRPEITGGVGINLWEISSPSNGSLYLTGEPVTFGTTWYNYSGEVITDV